MHIIQGNMFRELGQYKIEGLPININLPTKEGEIFYIKTDFVSQFEQKILPQLTTKFKIITHNSDLPVDNRHINILNHPLLINWYGMNCNIKHQKLIPIPIGIANEEWQHGKKELLNSIKAQPTKQVLIYCNYDPKTNPSVRYPLIETIIKINEYKKSNYIHRDFIKREPQEYWSLLKQCAYVISPEGNSVDCHRIWESIYLGVIPIVKRHIALETFEDLPILFIDDWEELKTLDLTNIYNELLSRNKQKADFEYYKGKIQCME